MQLHFSLHGLRLCAQAQDQLLLRPVQAVIGPYACPPPVEPAAGTFLINLRYSRQFPSGAFPEFWRGILPSGYALVVRCEQGRRELEVPGQALAEVDLPARRADIRVLPGSEGCLLETCILPVLCDFLNVQGHYVIHAATLAALHQGQRKGVLISGLSGTGKTTAALALAGAGLELLADDMSLYCPAGQGQPGLPRRRPGEPGQLWGILLGCKVLPPTLRLLPWLAKLPDFQAAEGPVLLDARSATADTTGITAAPAIILFLNPRNPTTHQVAPLDKPLALARLVNENVRAYERHREGGAGRAFSAMADLVSHSDTYQVSLSPDLEQLGPLVHSLLR